MARLLRELTGRESGSIPELLAARAEATPDRAFLRWGEEAWSYAEAYREAGAFAAWLLSHAENGSIERVASYLPNRPEVFWVWFGSQMAGATYVSLNHEHRGAVLGEMIAGARIDALVTDSASLDRIPAHAAASVPEIWLLDEAPGAQLDQNVLQYVPPSTPHAPESFPQPWDPATVIFTSGSTGRSKAVVLPHNAFCRGAAHFAEAVDVRASDVVHGWLPLFHIAGQLHMSLTSVIAGSCIALQPRFSRSGFWEQAAAAEATVFFAFPTTLRLLWTAPDRDARSDNPLRLGITGGPPSDLKRAFEAHFGLELIDSYGMTEVEPVTVPPRSGATTPDGSCGVPGPDFEVVVVDEHDRVVEPGTPGEFAVRPRVPHVMFTGYDNDSEATVRAWRNLWFHTGDLGYIDADGFVYFVERRGNAIRRHGENVSPVEVADVIRNHPEVRDCAVVGIPSALGEQDVKAVVVLADDASLEPAELHRYCQEHMARFMVPRYIEYRSALPQITVGKVDKERLQAAESEVWELGRDRRPSRSSADREAR